MDSYGTQQWRTQEFFSGDSTNSFEDRGQRERGSGGSSPLVRGSGGSCSLVQEISFHIVKFSQFLVLYLKNLGYLTLRCLTK